MKTCRGCGEEKAIDMFHKQANSQDGRVKDCKDCSRAKHAEYYKATVTGRICQELTQE